MKFGFTGSQNGMDADQIARVYTLLRHASALHHGDCIGADEQAHEIAGSQRVPVVLHPPDNDRKRAFCQHAVELEPKPYLARNRDIVDATDHLIAAPEGPERQRSGTWATVRYARLRGKPVTIVERRH